MRCVWTRPTPTLIIRSSLLREGARDRGGRYLTGVIQRADQLEGDAAGALGGDRGGQAGREGDDIARPLHHLALQDRHAIFL
jgi:hypothetical protein